MYTTCSKDAYLVNYKIVSITHQHSYSSKFGNDTLSMNILFCVLFYSNNTNNVQKKKKKCAKNDKHNALVAQAISMG